MSRSFGAVEVKLGEALYRSEGHCLVCCELYVAGHRTDAVMQAARPIADVLPWLETELRSALAGLRGFTVAVAQIGAETRKGAKPRIVRGALKDVTEARAQLLHQIVGDAVDAPSYRASVGTALLEGLLLRYEGALRAERLNDYQSAYGAAQMAIDLLAPLVHDTALEGRLAVVEAVFPGIAPPEGLWRPDDLKQAIESLSSFATNELDAVSANETLAESLRKVHRLLDDIAESYDQGLPALSGRLAASLFVRTFVPIREEFERSDPVASLRLTNLLGWDLRRAINAGASREEVRALIGEAQGIALEGAQAPVA